MPPEEEKNQIDEEKPETQQPEQKESGVQEETETSKEPKENPNEEMGENKQTIDYGSISEKRGSSFFNKKILFVVLIFLLVGGLLGGGIYFYQSQIKKASEPITAPPPSSVVIGPTPTPEASVDLSAYSVQILNGSGTAGEAGIVKTMLEEQGFKEFTTGNAKTFDFTDTEVAMKVNIEEAVFDKIKQALEQNYIVVKTDPLENDSKYDIVITVGKKAPEPTNSEQ